jgi:hypothetical protein
MVLVLSFRITPQAVSKMGIQNIDGPLGKLNEGK